MRVSRPKMTLPNMRSVNALRIRLGASLRIISEFEKSSRQILRAAVGKDHDHGAAIEAFRLLDRPPQGAPRAGPREDPLLRGKLARESERRFILGNHPRVHRFRIPDLRGPLRGDVADALLLVGRRGLDGYDSDLGILLAQVPGAADDRARGAERGDE